MLKRHKDAKGEVEENISPEGEHVDAELEQATSAQEAPQIGSIEAEVEKLRQQIAEKDRALAELKDKYLRVLADSDNVRKRARLQADDTVRLQRESLLRELLPIIDNLERAVGAAQGGGNGKSIVEGVEMVLRSVFDFLKAQGVSQLASIGQAFDPQKHEAVDHVASSEHPPNTVIAEFHRGYQIGDRTLRPARVSVAKAMADDGGNGAERKPGGGEVENS
ncbi:MAG TPA: nucleotide exchange factor GrpE [Candidatus Binataceae bacterium]|nr:nucleotide exchange factor GrpE [Candidatus Binataceae bacterium]